MADFRKLVIAECVSTENSHWEDPYYTWTETNESLYELFVPSKLSDKEVANILEEAERKAKRDFNRFREILEAERGWVLHPICTDFCFSYETDMYGQLVEEDEE